MRDQAIQPNEKITAYIKSTLPVSAKTLFKAVPLVLLKTSLIPGIAGIIANKANVEK